MTHIVVIGGGPYGGTVANRLQKTGAKITLISRSEKALLLPAMIRLPFHKDPSRVSVELKDILNPNIELIIDQVVNVDESQVDVGAHDPVSFDRLVIATGAVWGDPIAPHKYQQNGIQEYAKEVADLGEKANNIVLVGGGALGVELAGEYAYHFPKKSITLIHSEKKLLDASAIDKVRDSVESQLRGLKVKLILGKKAEIRGQSVFVDGEEVPYDYLIKTTGPKANPPVSSIKGLVNEKNEIIINSKFQAECNPKIYAIGDVTNYPKRGLVSRENWLSIITHNLNEDIKGTSNYRTVDCPKQGAKSKSTFAVSVGPEGGAGQYILPFGCAFSLPRFAVVKAKSSTLFYSKLNSMFI
ncbi:hypothetical protein LJB42_004377 [Komagataella kurtzmanii]|nr:hypothetical protein LJB42_004377 [Komagataella kurtzmanii]